MKKVKWLFLSSEINYGSEETPDIRRTFIPKDFPYSDETLEPLSVKPITVSTKFMTMDCPNPKYCPPIRNESRSWKKHLICF